MSEVKELDIVVVESKEKDKPEAATGSCIFTFDSQPYYPFQLSPYVSSKYGSQVRERKIDRCLKQLQEALNNSNSNSSSSSNSNDKCQISQLPNNRPLRPNINKL